MSQIAPFPIQSFLMTWEKPWYMLQGFGFLNSSGRDLDETSFFSPDRMRHTWFLYPFVWLWSFGLIPCLRYCNLCCYKHTLAGCTLKYRFHILWLSSQELDGWITGQIHSELSEHYTDLHRRCPSLHSHQECSRTTFSTHPHQQLFVGVCK